MMKPKIIIAICIMDLSEDDMERKKLESLDLTNDVIEIILAKKRAQRQKNLATKVIVVEDPVNKIQEPEPTYYPPEPQPQPQPQPVPELHDIIPPPQEPEQIHFSIPKHILPWNRKKYLHTL